MSARLYLDPGDSSAIEALDVIVGELPPCESEALYRAVDYLACYLAQRLADGATVATGPLPSLRDMGVS